MERVFCYTRFCRLCTVLVIALPFCAAERPIEQNHTGRSGAGKMIRVPQDQPTIRAAVDAASSGDIVLVSPGVYREEIKLKGKEITLASLYLKSRNANHIRQTVLDGRIPRPDGTTRVADAVIEVEDDVGPKTRIIGFTITGGDDGISCKSRIDIERNRFVRNDDAIDYEGGGGNCRYNVFEDNNDDGVDLDGPCAAVIEHNVIRNNGDDGIEIRLHTYSGRRLDVIIRNNVITGNREDGIQIIDYPDVSDRMIRVERNVIADTSMAAIGCMADGNTRENYEAADIPEPIFVVNNTFVNNQYGITGGDSLVAVNNIFVRTAKSAMKKVDGNSIAAFNLFWHNGTDHAGSNIDKPSTVLRDPALGKGYQLTPNSPCVDAGVALYEWKGHAVLELSPADYVGRAPDLGAFEFTDQ